MMRATLCIALAASASGLVLPGPMRPAGVTSTAARTSADPEMSLLTKLTDLLFPDSKRCTAAGWW
eukprot:scaffold1833_cov125-Isochrysis_galbana.AAC.3